MNQYRKELMAELEAMQEAGRILRNLSLARMTPMGATRWQPAMDLYEAEKVLYLIADLAGVDTDSLQVIIHERQVRLRGSRQLSFNQSIACVHQLEIEVGQFERTIHLPAAVEVDEVNSVYRAGLLMLTLPKKRRQGKVRITVIQGE